MSNHWPDCFELSLLAACGRLSPEEHHVHRSELWLSGGSGFLPSSKAGAKTLRASSFSVDSTAVPGL